MTPFIKKKEIKKEWYIINAQNAAVGRLASYISKVLRGKNKPTYNPHMDNGDFVVVTNIDKLKFTGKKFQNKNYKKDIIDKKRIAVILRNISMKSKLKKIDPKITNKIWKAMIKAFIDYEYRNFGKK